MQAQASRAITAGNLYPQVQQAFGGFARIQNSNAVALPAPLRAFDEWEVGFNASWEIDVWGKIRRAVEADDARLSASIADYDFILTSLIAEVVSAYVDVRTFEERIASAKQNVKVQEDSLDLSTTRFEEGKIGAVGVHLAEANLNGTQATIPSLETGLRQANNRLCILLGIAPTDLSGILEKEKGIPQSPSEIEVGMPADLLRRRPDVRQALSQVAAQSAQVGVAIADFYPSFALSGDIYQASEEFGDLFKSASSAGSIGPSFQWNILNYGRLENNVLLQDARFQELVANYQNVVLQANQEVENAIIAYLKSQDELTYIESSVLNLKNSLDLLLIQFEQGKIDFSPIFVLQGSLRSAEDQLAASRGRVIQNLIAVYRALGGGWEIRCPDFVPQSIHSPEELELIPSPITDSAEKEKKKSLPKSSSQPEKESR